MRNKRLDVLRCIAVLLVIQAHSGFPGQLTSAGRVGVDLFFVLSGFLISGLLFTEYRKCGSIDFQRFFIRRSLKIYPAFYFLLLVTFVYQLLSHQLAPLSRYICELLYVQNYSSVIWGHEWSLAVEEHFYILLPLFLLILVRKSPEQRDPFRVMPLAFLMVAVTCLMLRVLTVMKIPVADLQQWEGYRWAYATTYCRLDALFFGVLLGYFHHFQPGMFIKLTDDKNKRIALIFLSGVLLSPCLILFPSNRFMITAGITAMYLSFGIILILSLYGREFIPNAFAKPCEFIGRVLAYVGMYSYSIYLWHLPVQVWGLAFIHKVLHIQIGPWASFALYVLASIALGIFLSQILEYPILRLRDRLFPSMCVRPASALRQEKQRSAASTSY